MDHLNAGIIELGCSTINFGKASGRDKATYGRKKVEQIHLATKEIFHICLHLVRMISPYLPYTDLLKKNALIWTRFVF